MHRSMERCREGIRAAVAGLSSADAERTSGDQWSVAAIVEHLDLTYTRSTDGIVRRLEKGHPPRRQPLTVRQRVGRVWVLRLGTLFYPAGRKAPDTVVPTGRRFAEVAAVIEPHLMILDQRLTEAARAFGARTPLVNHPFLGPCSVEDWRRFHWAHTKHHLGQIRERAKGEG